MNDFDIKAYEEKLRLLAAHHSNDELAGLLSYEIYRCVEATESEFCTGDHEPYYRLKGIVLEAAHRLRQSK